jgi:HK97 family phage portal protein
MEFRSIFSNVFGKAKDETGNQKMTRLNLLNSYENVFTEYHNPLFDDVSVRTCVNVLANHCSKLKPLHIRRQGGKISPQDTNLDYLLSHRPNPRMSTADFLKKIAVKTTLFGNCFIYIARDDSGNVVSLNPLDYTKLDLKEVDNEIYCEFSFSRNKITVPYSDVIHVRGDFADSEVLGDTPTNSLLQKLQLLDVCEKSLANVAKNSTAMRGYIKSSVQIKDKDQEKVIQTFNALANNNGVGFLDADYDYIDLSKTPVAADTDQLKFVRSDIYSYFGMNEAIVNGSYNEMEFKSFYESKIEPFALALSQEFTQKLFTARERGYGNEVIFAGNRLQYASDKDKVRMIYQLLPQGVLTINDALELLNMPPCQDDEVGNKRFMTKNNDRANNIAGTLKGGENE